MSNHGAMRICELEARIAELKAERDHWEAEFERLRRVLVRAQSASSADDVRYMLAVPTPEPRRRMQLEARIAELEAELNKREEALQKLWRRWDEHSTADRFTTDAYVRGMRQARDELAAVLNKKGETK
jgi:uncharacterized coiled-coil protein SlyX